MDEKILKCLYDIQNAISEVDSYLEGVPNNFKAYSTNTILKRAIERDLEIIGEAINRILKENPNFPINNARKIVALRNVIIHAYDNISDENIWAIIQKHIPLLKAEVNTLIKENS